LEFNTVFTTAITGYYFTGFVSICRQRGFSAELAAGLSSGRAVDVAECDPAADSAFEGMDFVGSHVIKGNGRIRAEL
jgi:hypothetical protein